MNAGRAGLRALVLSPRALLAAGGAALRMARRRSVVRPAAAPAEPPAKRFRIEAEFCD
jgi:hypothetical protein